MSSDSAIYVLVVEDEFLSRLHAVSLVEEAGYKAVEASNAEEAIAVLEARKDIRIVFTDIDMPGTMDGLKLAHAIRTRWPPNRAYCHLRAFSPKRRRHARAWAIFSETIW